MGDTTGKRAVDLRSIIAYKRTWDEVSDQVWARVWNAVWVPVYRGVWLEAVEHVYEQLKQERSYRD